MKRRSKIVLLNVSKTNSFVCNLVINNKSCKKLIIELVYAEHFQDQIFPSLHKHNLMLW